MMALIMIAFSIIAEGETWYLMQASIHVALNRGRAFSIISRRTWSSILGDWSRDNPGAVKSLDLMQLCVQAARSHLAKQLHMTNAFGHSVMHARECAVVCRSLSVPPASKTSCMLQHQLSSPAVQLSSLNLTRPSTHTPEVQLDTVWSLSMFACLTAGQMNGGLCGSWRSMCAPWAVLRVNLCEQPPTQSHLHGRDVRLTFTE